MLGLSGQLGIGGLGNFVLGTVRVGQVFVPHRGRARSALASPGARSALVGGGPRSTLRAANARSGVSDG